VKGRKMNREQIDAFLERHGLSEHIDPYNSAIELSSLFVLPPNIPGVDGCDSHNYFGYSTLAYIIEKAKEEAIQSFGDEVV
jgi:hypothetical protein